MAYQDMQHALDLVDLDATWLFPLHHLYQQLDTIPEPKDRIKTAARLLILIGLWTSDWVESSIDFYAMVTAEGASVMERARQERKGKGDKA